MLALIYWASTFEQFQLTDLFIDSKILKQIFSKIKLQIEITSYQYNKQHLFMKFHFYCLLFQFKIRMRETG